MMGLRSAFLRFLPALPLAAWATCFALLMAAFLMSAPFMVSCVGQCPRQAASANWGAPRCFWGAEGGGMRVGSGRGLSASGMRCVERSGRESGRARQGRAGQGQRAQQASSSCRCNCWREMGGSARLSANLGPHSPGSGGGWGGGGRLGARAALAMGDDGGGCTMRATAAGSSNSVWWEESEGRRRCNGWHGAGFGAGKLASLEP